MGNEAKGVGRAGLLAKENLTTGEAARVLSVSPQVVIRCIDRGELKGWKVPGSRARRVRSADLVAFARANGVPLPDPEPTVSTPADSRGPSNDPADRPGPPGSGPDPEID